MSVQTQILNNMIAPFSYLETLSKSRKCTSEHQNAFTYSFLQQREYLLILSMAGISAQPFLGLRSSSKFETFLRGILCTSNTLLSTI